MKISIAMCTFNGQAYLAEQLESIARQHRQPDELIICDDFSTDQTLVLAQEFARHVSFPVSIQQNAMRLGPARNFSQTILRCTGDIILPCDQDDHWSPEKLATFEKLFSQNSDCLLAFSDMTVMQSDGTPTSRTVWEDLNFQSGQQQALHSNAAISVLLHRNVVVGTAMGFRAQLAAKALPVPEAYMHDEWLAFIASLIGRIQTITTPLVTYRLHKTQVVGTQSSLREQWCQARKIMTHEYFENRIVRAQELANAVRRLNSQLIVPNSAELIGGLMVHAKSVTKMHQSWPWRLPLIIRELVTGRYHQFDYGLKGLVRDLLL